MAPGRPAIDIRGGSIPESRSRSPLGGRPQQLTLLLRRRMPTASQVGGYWRGRSGLLRSPLCSSKVSLEVAQFKRRRPRLAAKSNWTGSARREAPVFVGTRVPFRNSIDYLDRSHSLDKFLDAFSDGAEGAGRRCGGSRS